MNIVRYGLAAVAIAIALPAYAVTVTGSVIDGNAADVGAQVVMFDPAATLAALADIERTPNLRVMFQGRKIVPVLDARQNFAKTIRTSDFPPETGDEILLPVGLKVDSYLVIFAPDDFIRQGRRDLSIGGVLSFPRPIIGFMADTKTITGASWAQRAGIDYAGIEGLNLVDAFAFNGTDATYFLRTSITAPDVVRVFTAVPEPGSWAMLITGFGLIGVAQRSRRAGLA
jgi:hypothetical protein